MHFTFSLNFLNSFFIILGGWIGVLYNRNNFLNFIISFETALLGFVLIFIITSASLDDSVGLIMSFLILTVATADMALGYAITFSFYNRTHNIQTSRVYMIRG